MKNRATTSPPKTNPEEREPLLRGIGRIDLQKRIRLQGGSAHQRSVNRVHREQLLHVGSLDAAPIQDDRTDLFSRNLRDQFFAPGADLLSFGGGCGFSRSESPYGLIGVDDPCQFIDREGFKSGPQLALHHLEGFTGLPLLQRLAVTEHRGQARLETRLHLLGDQSVPLAQDMAALAVPYHDMGVAAFLQPH